MTRRAAAGGVAVGLALLLGGCNLAPEAPVVAPIGPTAPATALPQAPSTAEADYDDAAARIEEMLDQTQRPPIDTVRGTVRGTDEPFDLQILSLRTNDLSLVLHLQLVPVDGQPLDLSALDGGLSGELGEGNRYIADVVLADEGSDQQVLPTVYRPEVAREDSAQRCMCSRLPAVVPPEGVRLTAHYIRPESGFSLVRVLLPGAEQSVVIGTD